MQKHTKQSDRLRKIVEAFPKLTVAVLGDMVADEFVFGEISRVSREAPVLILRHRERSVAPGGGANADVSLLTTYMANSFVTAPGEGAGNVGTIQTAPDDILTRPNA